MLGSLRLRQPRLDRGRAVELEPPERPELRACGRRVWSLGGVLVEEPLSSVERDREEDESSAADFDGSVAFWSGCGHQIPLLCVSVH